VIDVAEITVTDVPGTPPNETPVAPLKLVPVIVTLVPPVVDPLAGVRLVTVGAGTWNVNWSAVPGADAPPAVVTMTSTAAAACAGVVTVIDVAEITVTDVPGTPPNATPVAPVKFVPVIVSLVPPAVDPLEGLIAVTVGAEVPPWNVNRSPVPGGDDPPAVVTMTSTAAAACAGAVTVIDVAEITVTDVPGMPPNETPVAPLKLVPVIVTLVPPAVEPLAGLIPVTVGAEVPAWYEN
jgi:hypothetical protein